MSGTTFQSSLAPTASFAGAARTAAKWRAGIHRGRRALQTAAELVETYSVIEGMCLLAALGFCATLLSSAFGFVTL